MPTSLEPLPNTPNTGPETLSPNHSELLAVHAFLGAIPEGMKTPDLSEVTEHHAAINPGENYQVSERGDQLVINWHRNTGETKQSNPSVVAAGAGIIAARSVFEASRAGAKESGIHGSIRALVSQLLDNPKVHSLPYGEIAQLIDQAYRGIPRREKRKFRDEINVTGEGFIGKRLNAWGTYHMMAQSALSAALEGQFASSVERAETNKGTVVLSGNVSQMIIPQGELTRKLGYATDDEAIVTLRAITGLDNEGIRIADATNQADTAMSVSVSPQKLVRQLIAESSDHETFLDRALPALVEVQVAQKQYDVARQQIDLATESGLQEGSAEMTRFKEDSYEADEAVVRAALAVFGIWHDKESTSVHNELQAQLAGAEMHAVRTLGTPDADKSDIQRASLARALEQCFGDDGAKVPTVAELREAKKAIDRHIQATQSERGQQ